MRKSLLLLAAMLCLLSAQAAAQDASSFRIVGYYPLQAALNADVTSVPFDQLTHVNLAFLNPDSVGRFTTDLSGLAPFVREAHRHGVKVLFSIAGGGRHPQYEKILQDAHRTAFIYRLVAEVLDHDLDGVDVDLEGSDISTHYEDFVVELAEALRQHDKLITAAIAVYYRDQFSDRALDQYDFVNVMVYDRTGPWRPNQPGHHSTYEDAVEDLEYFGEERGIAPERMTLGVPFYGYAFGPDTTSAVITMSYREIYRVFPDAEQFDEWAMPHGYTMYYNGIPTIRRKTALAREKASGIMIWQILGDAPGPHSLLRAINEEAGRLR